MASESTTGQVLLQIRSAIMSEKGTLSEGTSMKKYKSPTSKRPTSKLSIPMQDKDKWAKRVIAPYVTLLRRGQKATLRRDTNYYNFFLTKKSSMLMRSLKNYIANKNDLPALLYETADVMRTLTNSLGVRLYFVDHGKDQLYQYQKNVTYPRCRVNFDLNTCNSVACYVARTKEYVMINDVHKDSRFPDGVSYKDNVKPVLCVPIVTTTSCYAVIELYRELTQEPYAKNDLKMSVVLSGWIGLTIQEIQEGYLLHQKQAISSNLLQMVMAYYGDPDTLETLLSEILNYAKKELQAEKGTIYVITDLENTLADIYEEGITDFSKYLVKKKRSVNYGNDNTVACLVAKEMKKINIKNLCNDPRFKTQVIMDEELMVIDRTELCVPVMSNNTLLGIISMVNKIGDQYFTSEDEELMDEISTYAGLALFYAQARRQIHKTEIRFLDTLELLQYHFKPCPTDMETIKMEIDVMMPKNIEDFSYYILPDEIVIMPQIFVKMVRSLIPDEDINFEDLYAFVLTTQRSYRNNPYHNFEHAFTVAHAVYTILIRNTDKFTIMEREALMIAALTHDIDHYGVTNNFLLITNHYLSQLYEDSIWENHHCFVTEQLLRKYKLFNNITDQNEEKFLKEIHENIIFTDLVYYFKNRARLLPIIAAEEYNSFDPYHKYLTRNICMTMADMSAQTKPFSVAKRLTDALYREFFAQGDCEKSMGFTPLAMMDRDSAQHIPDDQAQFVNIVVMSCADLMRQLLPNTEELYYNAEMLRDTWRRILESRGDKLWRQCDSVVS